MFVFTLLFLHLLLTSRYAQLSRYATVAHEVSAARGPIGIAAKRQQYFDASIDVFF